jgi:DNA-3-methyladenine glycosylase
MTGRKWRADEFCVDASVLAPRLLGQYLIHETPQGLCSGLIVETEAYGGCYDGFPDDGAHSFHGLTKRTAPMFHAGGISYVYLIYGMYCCFNVVAGPEGRGPGRAHTGH